MSCAIINGWEYLTEINPNNIISEQKIQKDYLKEFNLAYHIFFNELIISQEKLNEIKENFKEKLDTNNKPITRFRHFIDLSGDNDVISGNYPIKFLKSKFLLFKQKKIKSDLIKYYKPYGFFVKGPFDLINNSSVKKIYIELFWNNE